MTPVILTSIALWYSVTYFLCRANYSRWTDEPTEYNESPRWVQLVFIWVFSPLILVVWGLIWCLRALFEVKE